MKGTALILAGAVAFDLGVMVVSTQAQQRADPQRQTGSTPPIEGSLNLTRTAPNGPTATGPASPGPMGAEVGVQGGPGGCVLRPGQPVPGGAGGPCGPAAMATGEISLDQKMETTDFIKVDSVNTIQACRARQGEVVRHQGVRQCRLPAAVPPPGNPRPGASPPRN